MYCSVLLPIIKNLPELNQWKSSRYSESASWMGFQSVDVKKCLLPLHKIYSTSQTRGNLHMNFKTSKKWKQESGWIFLNLLLIFIFLPNARLKAYLINVSSQKVREKN